MCGIAAIISGGPDIPDGAIERMTARLTHRGPDAQACVKLSACHLGHTRLSVLDLAGGSQPMTEEGERYWIAFNGEIFNYRELRHELQQQGWHFRTQSDTEVLLRAYQAYGEKALSRLNGQFAFVIWDQFEQRLFAARDRLGEKPLYWACTEHHFLLASEIKALLASQLLFPRIDRVSVEAYLGLLYVPPDRTIYENIHTLRPGHALSWKDGRWSQWAYWQPVYSREPISDAREPIERARWLIAQAVKRQMAADVPVGAFLSGGLDSSTIVAFMVEQANQPIRTFSVGFGDLINELPYAHAIAQRYRTNHHEIQMAIPVGELLERMAEVYDEPFADSSNIPTYLISEFARRHVKVVLSGDGGDEVFGGYEWYSWLLADDGARPGVAIMALLRLAMLAWQGLTRVGLPFQTQRDAAIRAYQLKRVSRCYPDPWERHLAYATQLRTKQTVSYGNQIRTEAEASIWQAYFPESNVEALDRATDFDLRCYLPGDILVKVDRATMAHGLESRSPFLDVDLVEFVLGLPWQLRFGKGKLKGVLRKACADLWPEVVQKRPKQGFGAPIWNWVCRPDVQSLLQRVCAPRSPLIELLPEIRRQLPVLTAQQQWTVLCLGLWLEKRPECLHALS